MSLRLLGSPRRRHSTRLDRRSSPSQAYSTAPTRTYLYDVDVHGQLFLSDTKQRNFVTCFKDPAFLKFFYSRVKMNEGVDPESLTLKSEGYEFVSPCGKELNFVRPADTVVVFQSLTSDGGLTWACRPPPPSDGQHADLGESQKEAFVVKFEPDKLKADSRGYLYHPSPDVAQEPLNERGDSSRVRRTRRRRADGEENRLKYGAYSLMRSSLVLEAIAPTLELVESDDEAASGDAEDTRGTFVWQGRKYDITSLDEQRDVWRSSTWSPDQTFE
ncbi:hypothetical protein ACM66B_000792 [Microbotryomycetes sp. NB124-2]